MQASVLAINKAAGTILTKSAQLSRLLNTKKECLKSASSHWIFEVYFTSFYLTTLTLPPERSES